ncbi:MAG: hypothetical protein ACLFQY_17465 [Desulfococcaceae bacterium]
MRFLDILKITGAIVLILFGALIGLGALVDSKPSDMSPLADFALVVLFSLVPLLLGILIIYRVKRRRPPVFLPITNALSLPIIAYTYFPNIRVKNRSGL